MLKMFCFLLGTWNFGTWFPGGTSGKEPTCQCRRHKSHGFDPWVRKMPRRREWQPTPAFLLGEFHGQRTLVGHSPWGHKESDTTELLSTQAHMQLGFLLRTSHLGILCLLLCVCV